VKNGSSTCLFNEKKKPKENRNYTEYQRDIPVSLSGYLDGILAKKVAKEKSRDLSHTQFLPH
jgi:hypothetical protein